MDDPIKQLDKLEKRANEQEKIVNKHSQRLGWQILGDDGDANSSENQSITLNTNGD